MPAYTFYPYAAQGLALTFEDTDLPDEATAYVQARRILAEHDSAVEVQVWQDDRLVHREVREQGASA
ncbi:hypothetical protein [Phenylobacterium sp.]|uniref:hypothetical protein n=1 Tax=Phenylobacterium sp. TaxID=1871053 RepID=UPI003BAC1913